MNIKTLWELFYVFAKIGGFTFGGGYAMLPILQAEVVEKRGWATEEELMDYYAIGQCTPGIIAVNTATFIGNRFGGILGGVVATLGCVFPSMVIITLIAAFIRNFAELAAVQHILGGIRAAVCVLIFSAIWKLGKKAMKGTLCWCVGILVLLASLFTSISSVWLVIAAGLCGIIAGKMEDKAKGNASADMGNAGDKATEKGGSGK